VPGMGGGLTLATLDAGKLELRVSIKDGVATIERMESKGKDLELNGSGSIRLANPVSQSRADVLLSVKISDAYKQQNDKTKMMFELMDQNPVTQAAKTSDGSLRFRLTGTLAALRPVPGGAAGPSGRAGRAARKKVAGPD
jgi:type II secretion system protein N